MHELVEEQRQAGTSIFFSTHLLDQAERLCTRIGILYNGKLAAVGDLEELRGSLQQSKSLEDIFFEVTSDTPSADTFSSESHEPSEQISPVNDRRTPDE
jgi:ABC-type multidrug transport system ATPase subunit